MCAEAEASIHVLKTYQMVDSDEADFDGVVLGWYVSSESGCGSESVSSTKASKRLLFSGGGLSLTGLEVD